MLTARSYSSDRSDCWAADTERLLWEDLPLRQQPAANGLSSAQLIGRFGSPGQLLSGVAHGLDGRAAWRRWGGIALAPLSLGTRPKTGGVRRGM